MTSFTNLIKKWLFNYDKRIIKLECLLIFVIGITALPFFLKFTMVDYDAYTNKKSFFLTSIINKDRFVKGMLGNDLITLRESLMGYTSGFSSILHCENDADAIILQNDLEYMFNGDIGFLLIDKNSGRYFSNRNWFKDYPYNELSPKEALIKLSQEDDVTLYSSDEITHYKAPYGYYNGAFNPPLDELEEIYFIRSSKYSYMADMAILRFYFSLPCIVILILTIIKHIICIKNIKYKNYLSMYSNVLIIRILNCTKFTFTHIALIFKRIFFDRVFICLIIFWIIYLPLSYIFKSSLSFKLPYGYNSYSNYTPHLFLFTIFIIISTFIVRLLESVINSEKLLKYLNKIETGDIDVNINPHTLGNYKNLGVALNNLKINYSNKIQAGIKNEKLKTELITNVSHDLKTPLTSIVNYVDILKDETLSNEAMRDYISILDNKATKLQCLVEDLFEMSKMTSGQIILEKSDIDMVELIYQNLGELDFLGEDKHLTFKVIGDKSCYVNVDGARMSRVMDNLICNAIKYSLENSRIYLSILDKEKYCVMEVKNISKYDLDFDENEILERFVRGDKSRNSSTEGSGLGLAIAKTIVELHQGTIKVKCDGDLFKVIIKLPK